MDEYISEVNGQSLSLSCLRLLVPPIRLISAAVWHTVRQKVVLHYGMLEEFVYMVTDIVPQLLKARQRAELIFGLRARLILELCRSEETSESKIIQPHLDRMQFLLSMWDVEIHNAGAEISDSHFLGLVHSLLRDAGERDKFFKYVFPDEFGPTYDKAIQSLMWQFLSRLEELLPVQTIPQVASLLTDSTSVLQESLDTVFHLQELKPLLESQKDLNRSEDNDSSPATCILPTLFLPPVERAAMASELTGTIDEGTDLVYRAHGLAVELVEETETEEKVYIRASGNEEEEIVEVEVEEEEEEREEEEEAAASEYGEHWLALTPEETALARADADTVGHDMVVPGKLKADVDALPEEGLQSSQMACYVMLQRLNAERGAPPRPVRRNRGLKMKRYLQQRRKGVNAPDDGDGNAEDPPWNQPNNGPRENPAFYCTSCHKEYRRAGSLLRHKCPNQSPFKGGLSGAVKEEAEEEAEGAGPRGEEIKALPDNPSAPPAPPASVGDNRGSGADERPAGGPEATPGPPFSCPHCSVEFKCKKTFSIHLRTICYSEQQVDPEGPGGAKQGFRCDECGKAFRYRSTLDSHKQTHNPLYCDVCAKLVRDAEALAMHKRTHTPFQCNLCAENFRVFKALHKHYVDAHSPSGPFDCSHCGAACGTLKRLIRHEWKHTGHQPFQCPHCPKRFRSYSDLLEHQKKHTKAYPFLCWECGKTFRHSITLTRHVRREHRQGQAPPEKPQPAARFPCPSCPKSFLAQRCLLRHVDFYHKTGHGHPCPHCAKSFVGKDSLVRHILIHTGEKPFKCDDCDKCFRSASERRVHSRYHTGERPFKCKVCEKGFVQSCFLTLHMRTHTGERPYACSLCPKAFASRHGVKRHKRLVHA